MTEKQYMQAVKEKKLLALVEFRGCTARDSADTSSDAPKGSRNKSIVWRVEMERGQQQEIIENISAKKEPERHAKFDAEKFNNAPMPFRQGQICVWHIAGIGWKGEGRTMKRTATGTLEAFEG